MHDIRLIRDDPAAFDAAMARRGLPPLSAELLSLDADKRAAQTGLQTLQAKKNTLAKDAGKLKATGQDASALFAEAKAVGEEMTALEAKLSGEDELFKRLSELPNRLAADVPDGADESANVEIDRAGEATSFAFEAKDHVALGEALGLMDFETAAKMSGARFVILSGALARLERALAAFMLQEHTEKFGYTEMSPPVLVKDNALFGTGQLPKFDNGFETTNGYYLIPTAEVSLTNIAADTILPAERLPRRYVACTPCFRSEAGSAGRDTRGMIRQHQFLKVELVSIVAPEQSAAEHERMLGAAKNILEKLKLPYRTMLLASGDTGFGSQKTFDLEVWLPGQGAYREISSCSNFGDFQARRMNARYRTGPKDKPEFVHTLNGSGLAVGRAMVAVMENYQNTDGSITVPEVLVPYMNGMTKIEKSV